jgi:hypothetical protein
MLKETEIKYLETIVRQCDVLVEDLKRHPARLTAAQRVESIKFAAVRILEAREASDG